MILSVENLIYGGGGATLAGLIAWVLRLRLQISREAVELRANRAKISQIDRLEDELDKATRRAEVAEAKAQVAESLRVEIRHLRQDYTRLRLMAKADNPESSSYDTDIAGLDDAHNA